MAAFQKFGFLATRLFVGLGFLFDRVFKGWVLTHLGFYMAVFLGLGFQMEQWDYTYLYIGFFMSGFL